MFDSVAASVKSNFSHYVPENVKDSITGLFAKKIEAQPVVESTPLKGESELSQNQDVLDLCRKREWRVAQKLIEKDPSLVKKTTDSTWDVKNLTPLHLAALIDAPLDFIEFLLRRDADINAQDESGWTPLHLAALSSSTVAKRIAALKGSPMNTSEDIMKWTPLHIAVQRGDSALVKELLDNGAKVSPQDVLGRTPLHLAKLIEIAELLIDNKARVDLKDIDGNTPLMQAQRIGNITISRALSDREGALIENSWEKVSVNQRGSDEDVLEDETGELIAFHYLMDRWTTDLYENDSSWKLRGKALLAIGAAPISLAISAVEQVARAIVDVTVIVFSVFKNISLDPLKTLKAFTIVPIRESAKALCYRTYRIAMASIFAVSLNVAALYMQIDPIGGRKFINRAAESFGEGRAVRYIGLAKVGNLNESQISNVAQFDIATS